MSSLLKNLLFALVLATVLWLGYTTFIKSDDSDLALVTTIDAGAAEATQEFLTKLQGLRKFDLSDELFQDPRFESLVDFKVDLGEEETGRGNPFLPVTAAVSNSR